jgi:hypothetical protein
MNLKNLAIIEITLKKGSETKFYCLNRGL